MPNLNAIRTYILKVSVALAVALICNQYLEFPLIQIPMTNRLNLHTFTDRVMMFFVNLFLQEVLSQSIHVFFSNKVHFCTLNFSSCSVEGGNGSQRRPDTYSLCDAKSANNHYFFIEDLT